MKKLVGLALGFVLAVGVLAGCGQEKQADAPKDAKQAAAPADAKKVDALTTASVVNNNEAFLKAISKNGTWIAATLNDLTFKQELVLEGDFTNKGAKARKIALYTQDENHKITASFKLTAPKLTIKSENSRIQGGTFIGDVYVETNNFTLQDATIQGNLYFTKDEYKASFQPGNGKVTGVTEVKK